MYTSQGKSWVINLTSAQSLKGGGKVFLGYFGRLKDPCFILHQSLLSTWLQQFGAIVPQTIYDLWTFGIL